MKQIQSSLSFILFGINYVDAQNLDGSIYTIDNNIPSYIDATLIHIERNDKNDNSRVLEELLQLNNNTTVQISDTITDIRGGFHESYKEYYKGIEVEGTRCTIHYDQNGKATAINGNFRTIESLCDVPFVREKDVLSNVIQHIGAEKYVWQENLVEQKEHFDNGIKESSYPKGKLVVYIHKNEPYLAYQFYIECLVPQRSLCAYADASTGFVLDIRNSVCESMASVTTVYSGLRNIETQKMRFYPKTYSPYYSINLTALDEQTYKISMIKDNLPSSKTLEGNITSPITEASDYPEWTLEAVNVTTGKVVLSELLREPKLHCECKTLELWSIYN